MFIQFSFGFNLHNIQISVASFCFGYYLGKRRPLQVYIEINDCIFRFKKMDTVAKQMQNLDISNDSLFGKDLTVEKEFLEKLFISFQQKNLIKNLIFLIMLESAVFP